VNKILLAGIASFGLAAAAQAAPLTLTGNYLQVGISDAGTFGSNGNTPPGILHDPTGTGNFAPGGIPNDYLTPGSPHDGFAINSVQTGLQVNDNQGPSAFGTASPTLTSVPGFAHAATWSGALAGQLAVTNTYWFNPNDQIIHIKTTLTALADLSALVFGRSEDPDPDVNKFGTYATVNSRGNATHAPEDLVSSAGSVSGLILGILNENGNTLAHNTGISSFCCNNDDPNNVLAGYGPVYSATNVGDYGMQMAWNIGDLTNGASVDILYAYVFGEARDTIGTVPEPASFALLGAGMIGLGLVRRRHG
jgi:hypothetical protein